MNDFWINIISIGLAPVTGVVSWIAASKKRQNDSIAMFQQTIDALMVKNSDLYADILRLRARINELEIENRKIKNILNGIKGKDLNHTNG